MKPGRNIVKKLSFFFALCTLFTAASAIPFYGNQSYIRWKTASTDHFTYIYPMEYTDHAAKVAAYAEAVYDSVVSRYGTELPGKVNLVIHNALYANGEAIPTENTMQIFLTNWDFKLRSSHRWLSDVVTHEFSHLVSIEDGSKVPPFLYGIQASYSDYYNERTTENALLFYPFTLQPLWLAEGTAQFESSRMGFDGWDTHRDMILRVAALDSSLLDLNYMHDFADNSLDAERGPYTQGFALVRYIAAHYGEDAIPKIWKEFSRPYRVTLDGAVRKVLGIGEKELYAQWEAEVEAHYKAQKDSLGELVTGEKLTKNSSYQDYPQIAGNNLYGISNFGGPYFDGGVFKIPLAKDSATADTAKAKADSGSAKVAVDSISIEGADDSTITDISQYSKSGFKMKKPWLENGISVRELPGRGPVLAFVTFKNRDRDGRPYFDIALTDTAKRSQVLTYLADASYPDISPKGTEIAFARREPNSTRFALSAVNIPDTGAVDSRSSENVRDLYVPDAKFSYYNIYSPKFSPDGSRIVFSYFDDKDRGIAVIGRDGKNYKDLGATGIDERDPAWIDNSTIVYSANKNGIFNLYSKNLNTGADYPLTNVVGGAFTPAVDSGKIYYTGYDTEGFSLYKLALTHYETTKDSIIHHADTAVTACPETKTDFLLLVADSTEKNRALTQAVTCKPDTVITRRDSTIKLPAQKALALKGSPIAKQEKSIELADIEFAGAERNYKPIPRTPILIPIFSIQEEAPDFGSVGGDGHAIPKLGAVISVSDPLQENTFTAGFLVEIGNGWKYLNGDGLNPHMESELGIGLENRSTPFTLALQYSRMNFTSKDTVRYEDPRSHDDSITTSHYAIPVSALSASAGYSIFKQGDTLAASIGYDWADFNLYEDNLSWTYQKRLSAGIAATLEGDLPESGSNTSGQGNAIGLGYTYSYANLYRKGTFAESFVVSSSGKITPIYRKYDIHEMNAFLYGSIPNPIQDGARFAAGASVSGILGWNARKSGDTLDRYYYQPLFLEGYPYLISSEDYNRSGMKIAKAEVHYLFPIYDDFRNSFWILSTRDFYIDLYAQTGCTWNDHGIPMEKIKKREFWDRSVGIELRISNKVFYSVPFDISINFARALDRTGEDENGLGGRKMNPIGLPLISKNIAPTRIGFAIGMGFNDRWKN